MKLLRKIRNKNGFTLAELLVVIGIITVLAAVAIPGVATYSKKIRLRELDDSARAIYMAAQHKFTAEVEMGEDIRGKSIPEPMIPSRYDSYKLLDSDEQERFKENLCYIIVTNGSPDPAAGGLVNTSVIESELADNNYVIEYNAETGDVYGVFYSNETAFDNTAEEEYQYADHIDGDVFKQAASGGETKGKLVGYYGEENISIAPESGELPKPEVTIKNKEKLVLEITTPDATHFAPEDDNRVYVCVRVNDTYLVPRNGEYFMSPSSTAILILDSLETGKTVIPNELAEVVFEQPFCDWAKDIEPGSDITVEVTFYDKSGIRIDQTEKRTENSLFAKVSTSEGKYTAHIKYGRHLQNLDKCASLTTAEIDRTIDFSCKDGDYEGWASTYSGRKFKALNSSSITISANSGAEIQYIDIEGVADYAGLFSYFSGTARDITFRNPKSVGYMAGILVGYSDGATINNIKVINATVQGDFAAGGLIGNANDSKVSDCEVYVGIDDKVTSWDNPNKDPYSEYTIASSFLSIDSAGGILGVSNGSSVKNSYAAVKVKGNMAGGLIGCAYYNTTIEDSFSAGHTYYGNYTGKTETGEEISLKDNITGNTAGGIISKSQSAESIVFKGTVFSTCSVTGGIVDPIYNRDFGGTSEPAKFEDDPTVYSLGIAYKDNGDGTVTEIKQSKDTNVLTSEKVKDETLNNTEIPYDLYLRSQNFNYPVPGGLMHGDWPTNDKKPVTGFFYWEKEDGKYHIYALGYDGAKLSEIAVADKNKLCKDQDAKNIESFGYGAFSAGGELASTDVTLANTSSADLTGSFDIKNPTTNEIAKILAAVEDLNEDDSDKYSIILYTLKSDQHPGLVTATVGEQEYTFAPEFYALYAEKDGERCGTAAGLFGVRAKEQLINAANHLDGKFEQSHDIDFDGSSLTPIGNSENVFKGAYNGGSYRILNAEITSSATTEHAGLFGVTKGATLENIVMFKVAATAVDFTEITGKNVGVIVGEAGSGVIRNCVAAGYTLTGSVTSGGVAGKSSTEITNCEANIRFGKVTGAAGGIVGDGATVKSSYALVHGIDSPSSKMDLGGIAGKATGVEDCYVIFSGQTVGYPVANVTDNSKNYFANDSGFCSISKSAIGVGNGLKLQFATPSLSSVKKCYDDQISYIKDVKRDEDNGYILTAVVKDEVAGKIEGKDVYVHYGLMPEEVDTSGGYLSNGPLAGVFNFYIHYTWDNNGYDGFMVYNKFGKVYSSNYCGTSWESQSHKPLGVFVNYAKNASGKVLSPLDYGLRIEVNGVTWTSFKLLENAKLYQGAGYLFYPRDSDDRIIDHLQDTDNITDPSQRFSFWEITGIDIESINTIAIYYTPEGEKEGMLLYTKREDNFDAIIPKAYVDDREPPIVGVFYVHTQSVIGDGLYARAMLSNGAVIVPNYNTWNFDNRKLGIAVETSRLAYDLDYIVAYYDYTPYKLTQWDGMTNKEDFEGYTLFLMDEAIFDNGALVTNFNIEIGYGSKLIYFAKEGNGVADSDLYATEEIRSKVGTVIYSEKSGNVVAKAQMGDGKYIGESSGVMKNLGIIVSSDMTINDMIIEVKDGNQEIKYQIFDAFDIANQGLFNGYKLYLLVDEKGAPISKDFKLKIRYNGTVVLNSTDF